MLQCPMYHVAECETLNRLDLEDDRYIIQTVLVFLV